MSLLDSTVVFTLYFLASGLLLTELDVPLKTYLASASMFAAGWVASSVELGRFFTVDVAIHGDHRLVPRGPYRLLRHPSYTGLLAAFVGLGRTFGSWPALAKRFGPEWEAHRERTWRLVPFLW